MDLQIEEFKKRYNIIIKKDKDNDHGNTTEEKADNEVKKTRRRWRLHKTDENSLSAYEQQL